MKAILRVEPEVLLLERVAGMFQIQNTCAFTRIFLLPARRIGFILKIYYDNSKFDDYKRPREFEG